MAFTPVIPVSGAITVVPAIAQAYQFGPINNLSSGSPQDLSAWTSLTAKLAPVSPTPNGADVTFGTVTANSSGIITLTTSATDLTTVAAGSARLVIEGKPTSGDIQQLLVNGTCTVQNA